MAVTPVLMRVKGKLNSRQPHNTLISSDSFYWTMITRVTSFEGTTNIFSIKGIIGFLRDPLVHLELSASLASFNPNREARRSNSSRSCTNKKHMNREAPYYYV